MKHTASPTHQQLTQIIVKNPKIITLIPTEPE